MLLHYCTYIIHCEAQNTFSDQCLSLDIIDISLLRVLSCTIQTRGQIMMYVLVNVFLPLSRAKLLYSITETSLFWVTGQILNRKKLFEFLVYFLLHHPLYWFLLGKMVRLNAFCDIVNVIFFP